MEGLLKEGALGDILLKSRIISENDISAALEEQQKSGSRFGESLVKLGIVTQEDIDWALSNQLDIPYVRLKSSMIDPAAVSLVSAQVARQYNLVPLIRTADELHIAIADPLNHSALEAVERVSGCQPRISVALIREIREMQEYFYGPAAEPVSFGFSSTLFSPPILEIINQDVSGVKFLEYLLALFVQKRLVALSLQPLGDVISVNARLGATRREIGSLAVTHYQEFILTLRRICHFTRGGEANSRGEYLFSFRDQRHTFQILMLKGIGGDFVTFRLERSAQFPSSIAELNLPPQSEQQLRELTGGAGLVVVTHRDPEQRCLLMDLLLEEAETTGKSVMLLGESLGNGTKKFPRIPFQAFSHGDSHDIVTSALEHDPDIIAIEDASESQTFIAASKAAMRGKLVLVGLEFREMQSTLRHLLYFWHKHYVIPTYIRGILSCKRVSLLCPECRQPHTLNEGEIAALGASLPPGGYYRPVGCPSCGQTGFSGGRFLIDLVPFDRGVVETFEAAKDGREVLSFLAVKGYRGSGEEGLDLLRAGEISPEEYVTSILL